MERLSRRNMVIAVLVIALLLGGAYVSATQQGRIEEDDETALLALLEGTIVAVQDCPYGEASCILGQGLERALQRGFINAVMALGAPRFYVCPGPQNPLAPSPLCDGVAADEGRTGYPVARRYVETSIVSPPVARARLQSFVDAIQPEARDEVGTGQLTLYGFSCTQKAFPEQNLSCAREGIILSAILDRGGEVQREVLVFWAEGGFAGRTLPFTELWDGVVLETELDVLFSTGGELDDLGEIHVIDQSLPR